MKLLLTSNGITNDSIAKAFDSLIGKSPKDTKIAFIPTAADVERGDKHWLVMDLYRLHQLGYKVDIIELTALSVDDIAKALTESDVIFVGGGNTLFLSYWMQKRGLFDLIPRLLKQDKVYAGISAGSMVASASLALSSQAIKNPKDFADDKFDQKQWSNKAMGLVDFAFRPHLDRRIKANELDNKSQAIGLPIYALDDQSALKITGNKIEIISEGQWLHIK